MKIIYEKKNGREPPYKSGGGGGSGHSCNARHKQPPHVVSESNCFCNNIVNDKRKKMLCKTLARSTVRKH